MKPAIRWTKHESKMQNKDYAHVGSNPVGQVTERPARASLPDGTAGSFVWERWLPPAITGRAETMELAKLRLEETIATWFRKLEIKQ